MKRILLTLITASCLCACSSPPTPPEPSGEQVWVNPTDFDKFVLESQP